MLKTHHGVPEGNTLRESTTCWANCLQHCWLIIWDSNVMIMNNGWKVNKCLVGSTLLYIAVLYPSQPAGLWNKEVFGDLFCISSMSPRVSPYLDLSSVGYSELGCVSKVWTSGLFTDIKTEGVVILLSLVAMFTYRISWWSPMTSKWLLPYLGGLDKLTLLGEPLMLFVNWGGNPGGASLFVRTID